MNPKKTALLGAVLICAVVYFMEITKPSLDRDNQKPMAFATLSIPAIEKVTVSRHDATGAGEKYTLVNPHPTQNAAPSSDSHNDSGSDSEKGKEDATALVKNWQIETLPGAVLDPAAINSMVLQLKDLKVGDAIDDDKLLQDFSVYGLDKPSLVLIVNDKGAGSTEVAFGKKNEYLSQRYVKVSGRPGVFLVAESVFTALNKGLRDVRSKTPLTFEDGDIRKAILESSTGTITLEQPAAGEWKLTAPIEKPASATDVAELLRATKALRVTDFLDGEQSDLKAFGLDPAPVTLTLNFREGIEPRQLTLKIGEATDPKTNTTNYYFTYTGAPSVFHLATDPLGSFRLTVDQLRDRHLVKMSSGEIQTLVVEGPDVQRVEIAANKTDWTVNGKKSDPVFVEQVLGNVTGLTATEFPQNVDADAFAVPQLTITLTKKGSAKETSRLVIGKAVSGKGGPSVYAKVDDGDAALISEADSKKLVLREETLLPSATPAAPPVSLTPPVVP